MIVAVASGKGGTGKTTVAAALAKVWPHPVVALDLDVEEPNLHLFLHPAPGRSVPAFLTVPVLKADLCEGCGACVALCQFKALSRFGSRISLFPDLCHGCGGCLRVCPSGALHKGQRELGHVETGLAPGGIPVVSGRLRIGEAQSPPLMARVRQRVRAEFGRGPGARDVIVDAPPGVSCPAMTAVKDADVLVLVTEPTPFGLHDLRLAVQAFRALGKPMGVVVNRAGLGDKKVHAFCQEAGLPILAEIPYRRDIAAHYARGGVLPDLEPAMDGLVRDLAGQVAHLAGVAHA